MSRNVLLAKSQLHPSNRLLAQRTHLSSTTRPRLHPRHHLLARRRSLSFGTSAPLFRNIPTLRNLRSITADDIRSPRCGGLGSLAEVNGSSVRDLASITNQLLLVVSIGLTYLAGAVRQSPSRKTIDDNLAADEPPSGSSTFISPWFSVKKKLLNPLDTLKRVDNLPDTAPAQKNEKKPLSLLAISEAPRLRLLWAAFQTLENQINISLNDSNPITFDDWLDTFPSAIQTSASLTCVSWLSEELRLQENSSDTEIISLITDKLKEDDTLLQNIRDSGKEDLYRELVYFIKFRSLSDNRVFNKSVFVKYGDSILEDMVVTVADSVSSVFLDLISVDGTFSSKETDFGLILCRVSTRQLQKLRNEVALSRWMYRNVEAVVAMYEDRFELRCLKSNVYEYSKSGNGNGNEFAWWKRLGFRTGERSGNAFFYVTVDLEFLPVKRTRELRALSGWRYYFSLYLEVLDVSMPFVRAVVEKIGNAVSFFLVSLIGRSLGLIYTGIRQSLRWK